MAGIAPARPLPAWALPLRILMPLVLLCAAGAAALLVAQMGLWSLLLPLYGLAVIGTIALPKQTAVVVLFAVIAFEPGAIDFTGPVADALYQFPPGWENAFGVTTSPVEVVAVLIALSLSLRGLQGVHSLPPLPLVAQGVLLAIALGLVYGLARGGPSNLAYTESRGLFVGIAVFTIAARLGRDNVRALTATVLASSFSLAVIVLLRYWLVVRPGNAAGPVEFHFDHANSVLLGVGLVVGGLQLLAANGVRRKLMFVVYCLLIFAAMIVMGRRAATLVLMVGGLSMGGLLLPKRPVLVISLGVPVLLAFAAYLGAYWNKEYGAMAQPARAVRSQIDPSLRDESSDTYRTIEKANVIETIRVNRIFGVGFGRPFIQFQGLPYLQDYWPLQLFTPHQSILWLWLKMGWFGISVFLGFAIVALKRCVEYMRSTDATSQDWNIAAVLFTTILMFLVYATVDLAFAGSRQLLPFAIAIGLVFALPRLTDGDKA